MPSDPASERVADRQLDRGSDRIGSEPGPMDGRRLDQARHQRHPAATLTALQQYMIVTANYWAFTLTDGALRMLVVFHFHALGYSTLEIALLFLFYEFFGILTNLYGGWLGGRFGLRLTLWTGTLLQVAALLMLIPVADSWPKWWSVAYVMVA